MKTAHANSPPNSKKLPQAAAALSDAAAAASSNACAAEQPSALQQAEAPVQQQAGQQQEDRQPGAVQLSRLQGGDVHQLVLTPQEVLQELLGDMYIDQPRLTMGGYCYTVMHSMWHSRQASSGGSCGSHMPLATYPASGSSGSDKHVAPCMVPCVCQVLTTWPKLSTLCSSRLPLHCNHQQ